MKKRTRVGALALIALACTYAAERPNVILIMVDDMGFSDLGYHGGEIDTPNINQLAHGGVRFSQFYNSGRCCPTRATLMTGLHPHQTGIGHMTQPPESNRGASQPPAYQGYLNRQCVTVAEILKGAGYATLMSGKWHLGYNQKDRWPLQRGFEKYFGCISGATRFFYPEAPRDMVFMNEEIAKPESTTDEAFYTTDAFTDYAIRFFKEEQAGEGRPSFLYLAYTAPHWPLQAFEDDIARYRGTYKKGWDKLREERYQRQLKSGLILPSSVLSPRTPKIPDWDSLDEKKQDEMDLKMSVYAAMIDRVDQNIGKLVQYLKDSGTYDNTLIFFLSDNGGCQEGGMLGRGNFYDIEKRNMESGNSYGEAWANASNTPFRLYKHFAHEGGAATPFLMHWPAKISAREQWYREPAQLIDIVPTIVDVTGAKYPAEFHGNAIPALDGVSLRPAFTGQALGRTDPIFIEHENNAFVRAGDWKLVGRGVSATKGVDPSKWELYNMKEDRTETKNRVAEEPERVKDLAAQWSTWATRAAVYPKRVVQPAEPSAEEKTPDVAGNAFRVTADIQAANPQGVVVSHGGVQFGYSVFFVNGKPAFAIRDKGKLTTLVADKAVSGKLRLWAALNEEEMTIRVDGEVVARRASPGLISAQPGIALYKGLDFKDPVADYAVPNRFNGRILKYTVTVDPRKVGMRSTWGEDLDPAKVWAEYPRPQLQRDQWTNLNGYWEYAVTPAIHSKENFKWDGKILVPFALEAPLSGVERRLEPDEMIMYKRIIEVSPKAGRRYILNFEAVDYNTMVMLNGEHVGLHLGGNLPFSFDVTDQLKPGENELTLHVTDATDSRGAYQLHGKQRLNPKGIWYTPVSGIWQTVWMEEVAEGHIKDLKISAGANGKVVVDVNWSQPLGGELIGSISASLNGKKVVSAPLEGLRFEFSIPDPKPWSPDSPTLYDLEIAIGDDTVKSYMGLRDVGRKKDEEGHWRLTLNGKKLFHWGTLDQGWWPDGLLTPPSDEAMVSDIQFLKEAGFNTIRKHIKVEPRRYYYHCDKVGMVVWQDQVSAMADNPEWTRLRPDPVDPVWPAHAHAQFMVELKGMMDALHNHPSIVMWVPFNERWGQHQTVEVGEWTIAYDPTRLVNVASGGNFLPVGHVADEHHYPDPAFPFDQLRFNDYVKVVGEFGGHGYPVEGHVWDPGTRNWGYGGLPKDKEEWEARYRSTANQLGKMKAQGIAAGIYTQTTDVEGEINGLITYDRKIQKLSAEKLRKIHVEAGLIDL